MAATPEPPLKESLMSSTSFRRLAPLALVLVLATPWTAVATGPAAGSRSAKAASAPARILALWTGWFSRLWAEEGCIIDPSGRCTTAPKTDEGCIIDPNGRCRATQ
jgi:hypothetical protein